MELMVKVLKKKDKKCSCLTGITKTRKEGEIFKEGQKKKELLDGNR